MMTTLRIRLRHSCGRAALLAALPLALLTAQPALAQQLRLSSLNGTVAEQPLGVPLDTLREGLKAADKGDVAKLDEIKKSIGDAAARSLLEWALLRDDAYKGTSARLQSFLAAHEHWPSDSKVRFKLEQALFFEKKNPADVIAYFGDKKPGWPHGRIALALALRQSGQAEKANALMRDTWRTIDLASSHEKLIREQFPGVIMRSDEKYRMHRYFYKEDVENGLRIGETLGGDDLLIAKARAAVIRKAPNAAQTLDKVPVAAQGDAGYVFSKVQFLRRGERFKQAIDVLAEAPRDPQLLIDGDEWWVERRLLARAALDMNDPRMAYKLCAMHTSNGELERMEAEFHAGWIALRFLNDARTADKHFAILANDAQRPISVARGAYWRARAAEVLGKKNEAKDFYQDAAKLPTTYYGLLAKAKLGNNHLTLRPAPAIDAITIKTFEARDTIRALRMLIAAGETEKAKLFVADMADDLKNPMELALLAEIGGKVSGLRYSMLVGKQAMQRGMAMETYAFPFKGLPEINNPLVERALVLAIARQESTFDPDAKSSAGATGLLQLLPNTAAYVAKKYSIPWQPKRIAEPEYNMQIGTAYLGELINNLGGSYILTFASYNAGRSRVNEWIAKYGDPRDPTIDPIDWVERIPFSETRNYVMRVMENLQVYRARMSGDLASALTIDKDLRRGAKR